MDFPPEVYAKICSFTDDLTIFNLSTSCKKFNELANMDKNNDFIVSLKDIEKTYDRYYFYDDELSEQKRGLPTSTNTELYILEHTKVEDIHRFSSNKEVASCLILTPESENAQSISHIITSISIKGDIKNIELEFSNRILISKHFPLEILEKNEDGSYEILKPFISYIPLFVADYFDTALRFTSKGSIEIKITKYRLSNYYMNLVSWLSAANRTCKIPLHKTEHIVLKHILYTYNIPLTITENVIGISIRVKDMNNIRLFIITTQHNQYIISAKSVLCTTIANSKYYNLNTKLKGVYYISFDGLHFHNTKTFDLQIVPKNECNDIYDIQIIKWSKTLCSYF